MGEGVVLVAISVGNTVVARVGEAVGVTGIAVGDTVVARAEEAVGVTGITVGEGDRDPQPAMMSMKGTVSQRLM